MITRREIGIGVLALAGVTGLRLLAPQETAAKAGKFEVSLTSAEWKKRLTPLQFYVLREDGTERPYSSPLNDEKRQGTFECAGCGQALFSSKTKFESGTGWPSFWAPIQGAVAQSRDMSLGIIRQEVHCSRCGGHLGHVFEDGPEPTGLRYCINGAALTFEAV